MISISGTHEEKEENPGGSQIVGRKLRTSEHYQNRAVSWKCVLSDERLEN